MLPELPYSQNTRTRTQTQFGGLDHRAGSGEGTLWDMKNLCSDEFPLLASRPPRHAAAETLAKPNGIYAAGKLFTVDGTTLYADGVEAGTVADSRKVFCALGKRVVILPDKLIYTLEGTLESLEASYSSPTGLVFGNGTYAGEDAELNSITTAGDPFPFRVGDAVTISGCAVAEHNRTAVIREISEDGKTLRFYENTFTQAVTESSAATLKRTVPDLDWLCENENRLWGCKGDTIRCCKLGDPYNWNVFDGVSTDAWSVETGSPGDFTGCVSFLGYPIFFKEDRVYKVYGSKPSNFEVMGSATLGVLSGCGRSLAVAGETLYYLSRAGVMAYTGGVPALVSASLGNVQYRASVAGSDGMKYYCSMEDTDGNWALLVYDTQRRLWHKEDGLQVLQMAYHGGLYALTAEGALVLLGTPSALPAWAAAEDGPESMAEFGDFTWASSDAKYPIRLHLRLETEAGTSVKAEIQYDSSGVWETAGQVGSEAKRGWYLPVPIRRCDHYRLRLTGQGRWRLYSMEHLYYDGQGSRK